VTSIEVGPFFPTVDGQITITHAVIQVYVTRGADIGRFVRDSADNRWSYAQGSGAFTKEYDCASSQEAGQLSAETVAEMKVEAVSTIGRPHTRAAPANSIPAAACLNIASQLFPSLAALRRAHALCDRLSAGARHGH
jgi:hypothetical protein